MIRASQRGRRDGRKIIVTLRAVLILFFCAQAYAAIDAPMRVRETAGVARSGEVIRSGIPIPRSAGLLSTAGLAVVDASGVAIPAQFRVLARWNAGRSDANAPIQWLLVSFPASVSANGTSTYRLTTGSNPSGSLRLTRDGNRVVIDTGVASFTIDAAGSALFEEVRFGGTRVAGGGSLVPPEPTPRRLFIEEVGPVSATVVIGRRRYQFAVGSATAIVRQSLANEGTEAVRVQQVRDTLPTTLGAPPSVTITGARGSVTQTMPPASLVQRLRASRTAPSRYDIETPAGVIRGEKADGGIVELRGSAATIAVALERMHQYEPQALRALADGTIAIDLAADQFWLGPRQAMFTTMAIGASGPDVWAALNHPLRAWPDASWFAKSDAVDPFPAGAVLPEHARYEEAVRGTLERTIEQRDDLGIHGLMTFGLTPRIWGNPIYSDEVDCADERTPGENWDDLYWCTTWTDYHNTTYTAAAWAMRTGEVQWIDEITKPAALRVLYTQIFQCSPDDNYFYCGQAPAGYGGYRDDFNSSHAYFDNLQMYYWLTGDSAVVETLERGSRSMRNYLCSRRPAAACQPHDTPIDEWANLTGRVASQWISTFRFVGLASDDASYLDDYRNNLARAVTQQYVSAGGYGFLLAGWQPVTSSGRVTTDQLWMTALYDMKNLDRLRRDTNDAPIGDPPIRPSEVIASYARAIARYAPSLQWPNSFDVNWSGPRVGGTLLNVTATPGGGDPFLYDTGRSTLAAAVASDPSLRAFAIDLTRFAIEASIADGSPLGKLQGEYLARLHAAVAALAPEPAPEPAPRRRAVRH